MANNITNKDLQQNVFQEGGMHDAAPVTYRPVRPVLPIGAIVTPGATLPQNSVATTKSKLSSSTAAPTDAANEIVFRGVWKNFITYNINDAVIFNGSVYLAILTNFNAQPDLNHDTGIAEGSSNGSAVWTLIAENFVFNAATVGISQAGGLGNFDGQILKTSVSTGLNTPVIGPLTPSATGDVAFLALSQRETDLDSTWKLLYSSGATVGVAIKSLPTQSTLGPITLTTTGFPWGANLMFFKSNGASLVGNITATAVNNNVVTVTCANNFLVGTNLAFSGLTTGAFLNGQILVIQSATSTQFTVNFTHANYGTTADTGTVTWLMYRQMVSASFPGTNNSNTTNHLVFPNPVQAGSILVFVGITGDNNAVASLVSITDTVSNTWVPFGDSHFGCGASMGYCQSSKPGTVDMACFGIWSTPSDVGMAFEFPGAVLQGWQPYDVVEFRGSMWVCLAETINDAFQQPSAWGLIGPGTGYVSSQAGNYTALASDSGHLLSFTSSSAQTLILPNPVSSPLSGVSETGWYIFVENIGTGMLTISRNGLTIDGAAANITLGQNQGVAIFADTTGNYETWHGVNSVVVPGIFTVAAPNGSGQITIGLATETANTVWAGPTSGGAATPTFRLLVGADLPATTPTVPPELTVTGNVASPAGALTIGKATEPANTVWAGPVSGPAAQPTFRALTAADIPAPNALALVEVQGTFQTGSVSGTLRLPGNLIPPKGIYRVTVYMEMAANPAAGSIDAQIGWTSLAQARTASNGANGTPLNVDTSALNYSSGEIVIVSDGIHDITWTMTLI